MNRGRDQYTVFQPKADTEKGIFIRNRAWNDVAARNIKVTEDLYQKAYEGYKDPALPLKELRRQLETELPVRFSGRSLETGDVLAVTKNGIISAFNVDEDKLTTLPRFFSTDSSGALLTVDTKDYHIEGRQGSWLAVDELWIDGQPFFLMENQKYGKDAAYAVVDSHGYTAAEDTINGFSEEILRQIRQYLQTQANSTQTPAIRAPLENWQKSFENGEYLRAAEMAEEQNYSMIDGRMNNMPFRQPKKDGKESVLKRLRIYQKMIARRGQEKMRELTDPFSGGEGEINSSLS